MSDPYYVGLALFVVDQSCGTIGLVSTQNVLYFSDYIGVARVCTYVPLLAKCKLSFFNPRHMRERVTVVCVCVCVCVSVCLSGL